MEFYLKLIFIQLYVSSKDTLCYIIPFSGAPSYNFDYFRRVATHILYHSQSKKETPQFPTS